MGEILLGIDLGTTVLKLAAFDAVGGRALATASRRLAVDAGPDGRREQDPAAIDAALAQAVAEVRDQLGDAWRGVAGVALASQGGSFLIADRQTGEPKTPMRLWNDMRFACLMPQVAELKPAEYWRDLYWRDGPGWGLARMLWLRQTAPALLDERNIYVGAGEYVFFRLTGQWRQDAGSALQIGCYSVPAGRLDAGPLALVDVPLSFVAPLRKGHETHGLSAEGAALLALPPGTPAAGPYMDHEAGYLAAAGVSARPLQCSLGTAWVGNFVLPAGAEWTSPFQLVVPAPGGRRAGWQVIQPLLTGNVSWDWGLKTHLPAEAEQARASAGVFQQTLLPPDGLVTLPWLNMPSILWPPALGSGAVFGINASTTPAELLRSLAMGMSCEMLRIMEQPKELGLFDSVVLGGGASNAPAFQQMLAGLFHPIPTLLLDEQDWAGARGALYAFSPAVARATATPVEPPGDSLRADIRRAYGRYMDLYRRLCGDYPAGGGVRLKTRHESLSPPGGMVCSVPVRAPGPGS